MAQISRLKAASTMATVEGMATSIGFEMPSVSLDEVMEHVNRPRCPFCNDHGARKIPDEEGGGFEWMCGTFTTNKRPKPFQGIICMVLERYQKVEQFLESREGEPLADEALEILGNVRGNREW